MFDNCHPDTAKVTCAPPLSLYKMVREHTAYTKTCTPMVFAVAETLSVQNCSEQTCCLLLVWLSRTIKPRTYNSFTGKKMSKGDKTWKFQGKYQIKCPSHSSAKLEPADFLQLPAPYHLNNTWKLRFFWSVLRAVKKLINYSMITW